ncbi:MAG: SIR2 family NAD-dependent protein deacylase [Solirubrobacteraceae bacterium]|jgi:hypothetical protein
MNSTAWGLLLERVRAGLCTPFLGAGAVTPALPLAGEIARRWSREHDYPLGDVHDLARVAQYLSVAVEDGMWPKELITRELSCLPLPDFDNGHEIHSVLASLPLPLYITTNYDNTMVEALRAAGREPRQEVCRWNRSLAVAGRQKLPQPTVHDPLVYHLHGHFGMPESLVLTEDDYLDFLVNVAREADRIPHFVKRALSETSLMFVGYGLADWDFRVVHRGLVSQLESGLRRMSVTVQLPDPVAAQEYLGMYFKTMSTNVYWGTAAEFANELDTRWDERQRR